MLYKKHLSRILPLLLLWIKYIRIFPILPLPLPVDLFLLVPGLGNEEDRKRQFHQREIHEVPRASG